MDLNYPFNLGILFHNIAGRSPSQVALQYPDGNAFSYSQLDTLSSQLGHYLLGSGIQQGDVVAIFNNKSIEGYALMLACIKIGAIYTNLDVTSPLSRLEKILRNCEPALLVTDFDSLKVVDQLQSALPRKVRVTRRMVKDADKLSSELPDSTRWITGSDPAYIMFTSGSTGFPKGAVISQVNLINFIQWGKGHFNVQREDVFTNVNPIYFDNSVFDFYVSIFNGATLAPFSVELTKNPTKLIEAVEQAGCTSWFSVPSLLVYLLTTKAILAGRLPKINRFIFGGEGFPKMKLKKLFDLYHRQATLYNVYGPTECTCICSSYTITEKDFEDLGSLAPLGYLIPNFSYEILTRGNGHQDFGELALKGPNVGLGYFNDPDRTRKSFVQNPNQRSYYEMMYKTGDLVERDSAGQLHFKGRVDNQVKHMGYRIELEEIEAAFNSLGYVNECAVIYQDLGNGMGQIIAYVGMDKQEEERKVSRDVKEIIPDYMIPKRIIQLESLPKNQNGKIDRVALADVKT